MSQPVKHDANSDIFRGQLFLFLGGLPLAFAKSASMQGTTAEVDVSNKMMGDWEAPLPGTKGYTISSESLLSNAEGQMSYQTLEEKWIAGELIDFWMGETIKTEGDNMGGKFEKDTTKPYRQGKVMISSLDLNSNNGEIASSSVSLKGFGALVSSRGENL